MKKVCPYCNKMLVDYKFYCIYCGAKLPEKIVKTVKEYKPQDFGTTKLSFCDECGNLMFPTKIDEKVVFKCKCGRIMPFFENNVNTYKITTNIKHTYNEENIYRSLCGKKFQSHAEFLNHSTTCQKCKKLDIDIKEKKKQEKIKEQRQREEAYILREKMEIYRQRKEEKEEKEKQRKRKTRERFIMEKQERELDEIMNKHFNKIIYHCICGKQIIEENHHPDGSFYNHWYHHQYSLSHYAIKQHIKKVFRFLWYNKGKRLIEDRYKSERLIYRGVENRRKEELIDCFKILLIIKPKKHEIEVYINLLKLPNVFK